MAFDYLPFFYTPQVASTESNMLSSLHDKICGVLIHEIDYAEIRQLVSAAASPRMIL
jgi:hypothetical protein